MAAARDPSSEEGELTAEEERKEDDTSTPDIDRFSRIRLRACELRCSCRHWAAAQRVGEEIVASAPILGMNRVVVLAERHTVRRTAAAVFQ